MNRVSQLENVFMADVAQNGCHQRNKSYSQFK